MTSDNKIIVIGGGLAGCEAAWQISRMGCHAVLFEMKPDIFSAAHNNPNLAELVCSNSLKSTSLKNASGLLKQEMHLLGSLLIEKAEENSVPAGNALAVDRNRFSAAVTTAIEKNPGITVVREEIKKIPETDPVIIATGPLTSDSFSNSIKQLIGKEFLYFHDAISPVVDKDSIDSKKTFSASRYNKGPADYINCPLSRDEYYTFVSELLAAEKAALRSFEKLIPYEGCMPIEIMAERGVETLSFGPMKPVGLVDPLTGKQPYAVVQLRQENRDATLYNLVGFQTRLKWPEQKRVFSMIPGLENAEFARFGSLHRNTYINSPGLIDKTLQLRKHPEIFFAGQITGVEGYVESAAMGLWAGIQASRHITGKPAVLPPPATVINGLLSHITDGFSGTFQPMNANFGILPPLEKKVPKKLKKELLSERSLNNIRQWKDKLTQNLPTA